MPETAAQDEQKGPEKKEEAKQPPFVALTLGAMVLLGTAIRYGPDFWKLIQPARPVQSVRVEPTPAADGKLSPDQLKSRMAMLMAKHNEEEKKLLAKISAVSIKAKNECDRRVQVAFSYDSIDNKTVVSG